MATETLYPLYPKTEPSYRNRPGWTVLGHTREQCMRFTTCFVDLGIPSILVYHLLNRIFDSCLQVAWEAVQRERTTGVRDERGAVLGGSLPRMKAECAAENAHMVLEGRGPVLWHVYCRTREEGKPYYILELAVWTPQSKQEADEFKRKCGSRWGAAAAVGAEQKEWVGPLRTGWTELGSTREDCLSWSSKGKGKKTERPYKGSLEDDEFEKLVSDIWDACPCSDPGAASDDEDASPDSASPSDSEESDTSSIDSASTATVSSLSRPLPPRRVRPSPTLPSLAKRINSLNLALRALRKPVEFFVDATRSGETGEWRTEVWLWCPASELQRAEWEKNGRAIVEIAERKRAKGMEKAKEDLVRQVETLGIREEAPEVPAAEEQVEVPSPEKAKAA